MFYLLLTCSQARPHLVLTFLGAIHQHNMAASTDLTAGLSFSATPGEQEATNEAANGQPEANDTDGDLPQCTGVANEVATGQPGLECADGTLPQPTGAANKADPSPPALAICEKFTGKDACLQKSVQQYAVM